MRAPGGAHRAWAQGQDQSQIGVRPEKLFLSRPAAGLPDQPVQIADRRRGRSFGRHARRRDRARRHRAAASGAGRRQIAARPAPVDVARRSQPLRRGADGDRVEAGSAFRRRGQGLRGQAARHPALPRHLRRRHGEGQSARRRQRLGAQARRRRSARAARSRTSTPSASSARRSSTRRGARSKSSRTAAPSSRRRGCSIRTRARRGRCAARRRRTITATSPIRTCCRSSLSPSLVEDLRQNLPELPDEKKARFMRDYALSGLRRRRAGRRARHGRVFRSVVEGGDKGAIRKPPPIG